MSKQRKKLLKAGLPVANGITDSFLKLPIASTIKGIYDFSVAIKEEFHKKKLTRFLTQTETVTDKERIRFLQSLEGDQESFITSMLLQIERLDDLVKADILGKLLKATIMKSLTVEDFKRLSLAVERSYYNDVVFFHLHFKYARDRKNQNSIGATKAFEEYSDLKERMKEHKRLHNLVSTGLVYEVHTTPTVPITIENTIGTTYEISALGKLLLENGF